MEGVRGDWVQIDAGDFVALSKAMKAHGQKDLRRAMMKEIRAVVRPAVPALRASIKTVPARGGGENVARAVHGLNRGRSEVTRKRAESALKRSGLRDSIARAIRVVVKDSGYADQVGVRVVVEGSKTLPEDARKLPRLIEYGSWRHPVFGNRNVWVQQSTRPEWFSRVADQYGPAAVPRIQRVLAEYRDRLVAEINRAKAAA